MEKHLNLDGAKVHYFEEGTGYPVLLIHGWGDNARAMRHRWEGDISWPEGFRRIYPDLPGHGLSGAPGFIRCTDDILDWIVSFSDRLLEGRSFAVVGHSYGGYIAQGMVRKAAGSVNGLCLLAPLVVANGEERTLPEMVVVEDDGEGFRLLPPDWQDLADVVAVRNRAVFEKIAESIRFASQEVCHEEFLDAIREDPSRYGYPFDNRVLPEPYRGPTLIVTGRQDIVVGYEDTWSILDHYPAATFVNLHGTGHLLEAKEAEIGTLVQGWLKALPGPSIRVGQS